MYVQSTLIANVSAPQKVGDLPDLVHKISSIGRSAKSDQHRAHYLQAHEPDAAGLFVL